jgi:hypothetical protein
VPASGLIRDAVVGEWSRLQAWAAEHVPPAVARRAVAGGLEDTYFRAAGWWRTADGPHALMLGSVDAHFRRSAHGRAYFIAGNVRYTCPLPSLQELEQLARAYALTGMGARELDLEWTMERMIGDAISAQGISDPIERMVRERGFNASKGRDMLDRLLDVVDDLERHGSPHLVEAEHVARREFERSRRWLQRTASMRGLTVGG